MSELYAAATAPNHHFDTLDQQKSAANLGVWAFLITEVMMFGGLFMSFALYRTLNPEGFQAASPLLDVGLGTFNTVVLIGSSLTVAMAVFSAQRGNSKGIVNYLLLTIVLERDQVGRTGPEAPSGGKASG